MKPCRKNRKALAWLAANALAEPQACPLHEHLKGCEGCAIYYRQMCQVSEGLLAGAVEPAIDTPGSFHSRTVHALRSLENARQRNWLEEFMPLSGWGVAAVTLAVLLGIAALVFVRASHQPIAARPQSLATGRAKIDLAPTISNYQMIANQSVEDLDELLTRQANLRRAAAPSYTASSVAAVN
jgi:predicted anti-sigma-YlaC factor YlaD